MLTMNELLNTKIDAHNLTDDVTPGLYENTTIEKWQLIDTTSGPKIEVSYKLPTGVIVPDRWGLVQDEKGVSVIAKIIKALIRASDMSLSDKTVKDVLNSLVKNQTPFAVYATHKNGFVQIRIYNKDAEQQNEVDSIEQLEIIND